MIHIKVQYDAATRTFKLIDQNFRVLLEGDGLYDLVIPFLTEDDEDSDDEISIPSLPVAHA